MYSVTPGKAVSQQNGGGAGAVSMPTFLSQDFGQGGAASQVTANSTSLACQPGPHLYVGPLEAKIKVGIRCKA
jgi:hypothetical protein